MSEEKQETTYCYFCGEEADPACREKGAECWELVPHKEIDPSWGGDEPAVRKCKACCEVPARKCSVKFNELIDHLLDEQKEQQKVARMEPGEFDLSDDE